MPEFSITSWHVLDAAPWLGYLEPRALWRHRLVADWLYNAC